MTKQVQRRRGTATQHTSFTGAEGEISVNTTNKSVHVHDGVTAGGIEAARADLGNVSDASLNTALAGNTLSSLTITSVDINGGTIDGTVIGGTTAGAITATTLNATGGGALTGTWSDLGSVTTVDINGGTIDGTVIGGTTAAAITGTTGTFSGNLTVDTNTLFVDATNNRVGVGTVTPAAPLSVRTSSGYLSQDIIGDATNGWASLRFRNAGDTATTAFHNYDNGAYKFGTAGSEPVVINTANTERMRIDSSGNVGIGTSSPSAKLDVTVGGFDGINIKATTANQDPILTLTSPSTNYWSMQMDASSGDSYQWRYNNTEVARIDSSGNLLVGTTDTSLYNNTSGGGFHASANGFTEVAYESANAADPAFLVNNTGTDGDIIQLRKDGTTVGSIGSYGGASLSISKGSSGLLMDNTATRVLPFNGATNAPSDAAVVLGASGNRFKDIYLSGGVYLGGTGAANLLDDYEEGTWTPAFVSGTGLSYQTQAGRYTKVGNVVLWNFELHWLAGSSIVGRVTGLPFTVAAVTGNYPMTALRTDGGTTYDTGRTSPIAYPVYNSTYIQLECLGSGVNAASLTFGTTGTLYASGHYITSA